MEGFGLLHSKKWLVFLARKKNGSKIKLEVCFNGGEINFTNRFSSDVGNQD